MYTVQAFKLLLNLSRQSHFPIMTMKPLTLIAMNLLTKNTFYPFFLLLRALLWIGNIEYPFPIFRFFYSSPLFRSFLYFAVFFISSSLLFHRHLFFTVTSLSPTFLFQRHLSFTVTSLWPSPTEKELSLNQKYCHEKSCAVELSICLFQFCCEPQNFGVCFWAG